MMCPAPGSTTLNATANRRFHARFAVSSRAAAGDAGPARAGGRSGGMGGGVLKGRVGFGTQRASFCWHAGQMPKNSSLCVTAL